MRQVLQNLKTGETELVDAPSPALGDQDALIHTRLTLVSLGTEKMLIDFGRAGWISKAMQQPDKVRQAVQKVKTDGLTATLRAVDAKLDQSIPLGYSNVGRVSKVGAGVDGFHPGDLVVSNGPHADVVRVSKNLIARVPDGVSEEEAAFTVLGAIGLQGVRLLGPALGEVVAVTGLGLIGLIVVQLLKAHGCKVIGIDIDTEKCRLAESFGATSVDLSQGRDPLEVARKVSGGRGIDGVLITATTKSSEPVSQAARMCRKRGRIVLVGVTGLELSRAEFYEKELSFQVSCSYGPGRYDPEYEVKGHDYPYGFVRWTEQRNFGAILDLMANGGLDVKPLISHRFPFSDALRAYGVVESGKALGIILNYDQQSTFGNESEVILKNPTGSTPCSGTVALIGAGGFSRQVLMPALRATGCRLKTVVSSKGLSGTQLAHKFAFERSTTSSQAVIEDTEIDTVVVTTRHDSHAELVTAALRAGKKVYVEKPLCLNVRELQEIESTFRELVDGGENPFLMVGFNRRFAPQVEAMKQCLESVSEPVSITMTINAGMIPRDHWTQDPSVGGGRIIGEACHFIDLSRFLAGSPISEVRALSCESAEFRGVGDTVSIGLKFENGSIATIQYFANGHRSVPKERVEVFAGGKVLQLDNFRRLKGYGWKGFKGLNLWSQDKGHTNEMKSFMDAVRQGRASPIPFDQIVEVTRASFQAAGTLTTDGSDRTC